MPIPILPESEAVDKVAQTYSRIKDMLGTQTVPEPFLAYGRVQPFLQDFFMNFKKFVINDGRLDAKTKSVIALAVSGNAGCEAWSKFFSTRLKTVFEFNDQQLAEIIAIAATNSMYNCFFKFRDLSGSQLFQGMSVGLRAHTFSNTSFEPRTVELINVAISNLNACRPCTSGHVLQVRDLDVADEAILETIQCAATMSAGVQFLKSAASVNG